MNAYNNQNSMTGINSELAGELESLKSLVQNVHSESRLQQYRLEQQQTEIQDLKAKVQRLELHKATQLGQDKIVGFMVGAIVLSLLSLVTSIFFSPKEEAPVSLAANVGQEQTISA